MTLGVVVVLSVRHISEWRTERAAHHMDGIRACDTSRGRHTETSWRSKTGSLRNVVCEFVVNYVWTFVLYWTMTSVY